MKPNTLYAVVADRSTSQRARARIENLLGQRFWSAPESLTANQTSDHAKAT